MQEIKKVEVVNGLLDMEQAAAYLNIKKSTIYDFVMRKRISVVKLGKLNRFLLSDLEAFINQNRQPAINSESHSLN